MNETKTKKCRDCKEFKEISKFSKDRSSKDGFNTRCRECARQIYIKRKLERSKNIIPDTKHCIGCNKIKNSTEFDKKPDTIDQLQQKCKECNKEKRILKKDENKIRVLNDNYTKKCNNCNIIKSKQEFYSQVYSTDGIGTICRLCEIQKSREWRSNNSDKIIEYRRKEYLKNYKNRRNSSPQFKIAGNIRTRIRYAVKAQYSKKNTSTYKLIGCSIDFLINWLEYQFDSKMSWDNYGIYWNIDHVRPCSSFNLINKDDQIECFSWENCRPLNKYINSSKNDKIQPFQILLQKIKVHYYKRHIQITGSP